MTPKLHYSMKSLLVAFLALSCGASNAAESYRASYYKDGEIHVTVLGQPEGKPITTGHWDFKPSWSITGDHLVFFRRLKNDPVVSNWITQLCIINADGTGFHPLSDGTFTDFNPTWTRDGKNTPVWNRKKGEKGGYQIMASKIGGKPGEEIALTGNDTHAWVHSAVKDGRLFVSAIPPKLGYGHYLMTPNPGGEPTFERVTCELAETGRLDRGKHAAAVDGPIAGLLTDLEGRGLLKDTLVIFAGEFGRTPYAQIEDGRDHNHTGYTTWFAGAGVKPGFSFGETDEFGYESVIDPVHIHDWDATILHLLGLEHTKLTYRYAGRDMRLTEVKGNVVKGILA